jgi:uroporphyrinogen-III synthase
MSKVEGRRVLVTRNLEDSETWAAILRDAGAIPVILPCLHVEDRHSAALTGRIVVELPRADWLVFTSRRGIESFTRLHPGFLPGRVKVAVVGPATAAKALLGRVDLVSEAGTAASLAEALAMRADVAGRSVVLALAENAPATLEDRLGHAGVHCVRLDVYHTVPAEPSEPKTRLSTLGVEAVLLASPSAVTGFVNQVELDADADIFTIGPSTTAAAHAADLEVKAQAESPSLEGLMEAM